MKVAVIGSGNVATTLARLIHKQGHLVQHVASRQVQNAQQLANEFNATYSDYTGVNEVVSDLFIIAIPDNAIGDCISHFHTGNRVLVHTAGSVSKDILGSAADHYGVLYPLQSLRKEMPYIPGIPFLVDGNSQEVTAFLIQFAGSLGDRVEACGDQDRLNLHVAAVIVSNFTNHLYALAENFCGKENINFDLLKPLILETAQRIQLVSPMEVQTGPAVRKDIQTLDKHLKLLQDHPKLKYLYLKLTDSIMHN